jgi:hypothetical protein
MNREADGAVKDAQGIQPGQNQLLGQMPINPEIAGLCDEGNIENYNDEIITNLGGSLIQALPVERK